MKLPVLRFVATRAAPALAALVRLWSRTWRLEIRGADRLVGARRDGGGVVFAFAHGRMLDLVALHADRGIGVLVSSHPDGRLVERVVGRLGYVPVLGSRWNGGARGLRALLRHAASGKDVAITTDALAAEERPLLGTAMLARLSGHPIVPVAAAGHPVRKVGSWDRFEIPWPGARVIVRYGSPIRVRAEAGPREVEDARARLEASLTRLHRAIELELAGRPAERPRRAMRRAVGSV
jgi:hypothetical protein